ncbi:hypothetical protein [Enterococcus faecium]|uniref:hypothetical protein n=1 Tax=Enterococcus faecium TaxID=1352 RepID=UPI0031CCE937
MRLYIVQKFFDNEYLEDHIIFYDDDMMIQYLKEINQSSFFTYRGIVVDPFFEDIEKTFLILIKVFQNFLMNLEKILSRNINFWHKNCFIEPVLLL